MEMGPSLEDGEVTENTTGPHEAVYIQLEPQSINGVGGLPYTTFYLLYPNNLTDVGLEGLSIYDTKNGMGSLE